ncbi:MAG: cytochrome c peroxidase [Thermoanaerobaculia bacterium]
MPAYKPDRPPLGRILLIAAVACLPLSDWARAHIVPPEQLHPAAASYRRLEFLLNLNPIRWDEVEKDLRAIAAELEPSDAENADDLLRLTEEILASLDAEDDGGLAADRRRDVAHSVLSHATRAVARSIREDLTQARAHLADYPRASIHLERARQMWAAFEPAVEAAMPDEFVRLGECWLELASALGYPGLQGIGARPADIETFAEETDEVVEFLEAHFTDRLRIPEVGRLAALPGIRRDMYPPGKRLPPGFDINKQIPRPRQILGMATRGVDERDTPLIALGDMAFDSALIFGEPARSLAITCNTCHNKGVTNPNFFIPGLSRIPGGMDVSNSFFGGHANNGHFDPLDIPDLRGLRFTAPYGRNGRFDSLREFTRNVIVNEFSGREPEPILLDALVAYMLEFEFLPNPALEADGTLGRTASEAARRGEVLFNRPFAGLADRSCATCHVPSDHFLDRRRHDIGTVTGAEVDSRDRALDTPTLLGILHTAPYFHDGRVATLGDVVRWFDDTYSLGLSGRQQADLTAYLEVVGDGVEAYEDTVHTLSSELEEFDFFLSPYELLKDRGELDLIHITLGTIAFEIRAHKWDVQDPDNLPTLDELAALMDRARELLAAGDIPGTDRVVAEYRNLYRTRADGLE